MSKLISRFLNKIANLLSVISKRISSETEVIPIKPSVQVIRVIPWFKDSGDKTHRLCRFSQGRKLCDCVSREQPR